MGHDSRRNFPPKHKVQMVLEALSHAEGIGAYCRAKGVKDSQVHRWRSQIVGNADRLFEKVSKRDQNKLLRLEHELANKNEIIADLARENLLLKKTCGESMK